MRVYLCVICLFNFCASSQSSSQTNVRQTKEWPVVDALISKLEEEKWKPDDELCLRATLDMLRGVKNNTLWAVWMWDSMQPPVGSMYGAESYLGNYDQCLQAPWSSDQSHPGLRSQYCLVDVNGPRVDQTRDLGPFDTADDYYQTPTKDGRFFNQHSLGVCLPSICSPSAVSRIAQHLLKLTHLPGEVSVDPRDCEVAGETLAYPVGFYVFWATVGILVTTTILSTFFSNDERTAFSTITRSFCVKRNYRSLVSVSRDEVRVMHGMRFITAALIVTIHEAYYQIFCPIVNGLDVNKIMNTTFGQSLMHLEVVVDTFFAMSGLLITRGLLQGKQKNVFYTLLKRYFRLIGPYALCIMYLMTTAIYMDRGPFWRKNNRDEEGICQQYWWKSLLLFNTDVQTLCHAVTWYISCDFQLAILATFIFYLFRRNKKLGVAVFLMVAVTQTLYLGFIVYWGRLDIVPFSAKIIKLKRASTALNQTYTSSPARAGSYLVGVLMGYILAIYKPAHYRNALSKNVSITIATISLIVMSAVLCLGVMFADRPYDALEAAVAVTTNRVFWAIAVCSLIGVCEYGNLPVIPGLLSWSGFVPLSKLSYCLYLLHPLLIQLNKFNARTPAPYRIYGLVVNSCGHVVLGCAASFVLHLILEAPLINISNALLAHTPKLPEENCNKQDMNQNGTSVISQNGFNDSKKKLS